MYQIIKRSVPVRCPKHISSIVRRSCWTICLCNRNNIKTIARIYILQTLSDIISFISHSTTIKWQTIRNLYKLWGGRIRSCLKCDNTHIITNCIIKKFTQISRQNSPNTSRNFVPINNLLPLAIFWQCNLITHRRRIIYKYRIFKPSWTIRIILTQKEYFKTTTSSMCNTGWQYHRAKNKKCT